MNESVQSLSNEGIMRGLVHKLIDRVNPKVKDNHELSAKEKFDRFEQSHFVSNLPRFSEQIGDNSRLNEISRVKTNNPMYFGDHVMAVHNNEVETSSESDSIRGFYRFLEAVVNLENGDEVLKQQARAMMENLSFVGKKEYDEAARGISDYWKQCLKRNKNLQIMVELPATSTDHNFSPRSFYKSDFFLLDNILRNFSDKELSMYNDRIVWNQSKIKVKNVQDLKWVVLDDWSISGEQLFHAKVGDGRFVDSLNRGVLPEIQLIIGRKNQLEHGFRYHDSDNPCLLRSYYLAHYDERLLGNVGNIGVERITGFQSSVDYGFMDVVHKMAEAQGVAMPPLTNIIRPYRSEDYHPMNVARWVNAGNV